VIAESFERIHRSNLVGMGVLPLQLPTGQGLEALGLTGTEVLTIRVLGGDLSPRQEVTIEAKREDGSELAFTATARLDTPYRNGGILQTVLRKLLQRDAGSPDQPA